MTVIWEEVRASKESSEMLGPQRQLSVPYTIERALDSVARVSEAAGKASEPATKTWIQLGGPLSKLGEPPNFRVLTYKC